MFFAFFFHMTQIKNQIRNKALMNLYNGIILDLCET